jgi:aspartate/glutamate racemase
MEHREYWKEKMEHCAEEISQLEVKLAELRKMHQIAKDALMVIDGDARPEQPQPLETHTLIKSDRYAGKGIKNAILDILRNHKDEKVIGRKIYEDLMAGGFFSESKDIRRDVYIQLNRLDKNEIILSTVQDNLKHYYLKDSNWSVLLAEKEIEE